MIGFDAFEAEPGGWLMATGVVWPLVIAECDPLPDPRLHLRSVFQYLMDNASIIQRSPIVFDIRRTAERLFCPSSDFYWLSVRAHADEADQDSVGANDAGVHDGASGNMVR